MGLLAAAGIGLAIAAAGAGAFVYEVVQSSLMGVGSKYGAKVPAVPTYNVKKAAQCDPSIQNRWVMCF